MCRTKIMLHAKITECLTYADMKYIMFKSVVMPKSLIPNRRLILLLRATKYFLIYNCFTSNIFKQSLIVRAHVFLPRQESKRSLLCHTWSIKDSHPWLMKSPTGEDGFNYVNCSIQCFSDLEGSGCHTALSYT